MWLIADYLPTTFFSLRMSNATNAAAKTLLLPSPYCIKMALLDASFRLDRVPLTQERFSWIRDLTIRVQAPEAAVVNNCFVKILKGDGGRFGSTFALREYVAYEGHLRLAFEASTLNTKQLDILVRLLLQVNQLGKRGCFMQITEPPHLHEAPLDDTFATPLGEGLDINTSSVLQPLDEMQPNATLAQISTFSGVSANRNSIRRSIPTLVPYSRRRTSKAFTYYSRT